MTTADFPLTKREMATKLLTEMFSDRKRILISEVLDRARELDISRQTVYRASRSLHITEVHNGNYGAFWEKSAA